MKKVMVVDDQKEIADLLARYLKKENYEVSTYYDGYSAMEAIQLSPPDLVVLDIQMPYLDGIQVMNQIKELFPQIKVLMITAYADNEKSEYLLNNGAVGFMAKPFKLSDISTAIARSFLHEKSDREQDIFKNRRLIAESLKIKECVDAALKISNANGSVLISGESGTGKELMVDYIHSNSVRKYNKLVKINCSAIPRDLLEGELFGYEKGAFTGAISSKPGKLEEAHGGTLFLDEIGELEKSLQAKLLRVLEYKSFERLGSNGSIHSDFRLICATNEDILRAVREGRFREDLYYRISTFVIKLPPLRERKEDVSALTRYFIENFKEQYITPVNDISKEALEILQNYPWPGNIRELKNVMEQVIFLSSSDIIEVKDLPGHILDNLSKSCVDSPEEELKKLDEIEKQYILEVLEKVSFSKKAASSILGISEKTLYNKLEKFNMK